MLPFKNRLTRRKDFEKVQKNGHFFSEGTIMLKVLENGLGETRIGFIVGLKFSKKASARNQMKRQLRENFQREVGFIKKGLDIVISLRKRENEKIKQDQLNKNIRALLEKNHLLGEKSLINN